MFYICILNCTDICKICKNKRRFNKNVKKIYHCSAVARIFACVLTAWWTQLLGNKARDGNPEDSYAIVVHVYFVVILTKKTVFTHSHILF